MNFIESVSNYVLENLAVKDLPKISIIALSENIKSESIYILAGMSENDNSFEILQYFNNSLDELNIKLPSKIESAKILTKYYLTEIVTNPNEAFEIMIILDNEVYKQIDWENCNSKYIGEELKIEYLYTWYREIQDWKDNGILLYHNELNKKNQFLKLKENLVLEAEKALKNHYN
ncbi:hypothetical protein [Empedobacter brevis]|uniref:hypothetical protein n=1 Tax=Empedobacter brevis TaxID=247 RepID=UPI0039AF3526